MSELKIVPIEGKEGTFKAEDGTELVTKDLANRIVQQRLAEEKPKWEGKASDAEAKATAALNALEGVKAEMKTLESAKTTAEQSNAALQETFDTIMSGMSDEAKALVPDYGTLTDKIKFINKNSARFFNVQGGVGPKIPAPVVPKDPPIETVTQRTLPTLQDMLKPGGAQAALAAMDAQSK